MINYKIISKFIKELNFKIPNPNVYFSLSENIGNYKINIDIKSNQIKEKLIEVETSLALKPTNNNFEKIETKIIYSTIIEVDGDIANKKNLEKIILVEIPKKIYPEIREIFILTFEKSGFKEIKIDKSVDFQKLYNMREN